jgi:hypothetical protein
MTAGRGRQFLRALVLLEKMCRLLRAAAVGDGVGLVSGVDQGVVGDLDAGREVVGQEEQFLFGGAAVRVGPGQGDGADFGQFAAGGPGLGGVARLVAG